MELVLIGAGGHSRSCVDVAESAGWKIAGFISPNEGDPLYGYPRLGDDAWLWSWDIPEHVCCLIAVGQVKAATLRRQLYQLLRQKHIPLATVISSHAHVSKYAVVAEGTIVMHGAVINASATVAENCIINSQALVEHDVTIGAHTHISTGTRINGGVSLGSGVMLGSGSVILPGIHIADDVIIGAGSVITRDIYDPASLWYGSPARKIK